MLMSSGVLKRRELGLTFSVLIFIILIFSVDFVFFVNAKPKEELQQTLPEKAQGKRIGTFSIASPVFYISSCGDLGTPGATYTLLNDVVATGTCFTVRNISITLDCNGYSITGNRSGRGVDTYMGERVNFTTIKNCNIRNFTTGIFISSTWPDGISDSFRILNNNISDNTKFGIRISSGTFNHSVENNNVFNNGDIGFYFVSLLKRGVVKNNNASNNGGTGFRFNGVMNSTIESNIAFNNSIDGFNSTGTSLSCIYTNYTNNIATKNGKDGFRGCASERGIRYINNTASENTRYGFILGSDIVESMYLKNIASNNGLDGFDGTYFHSVVFEENLAIGNGGIGFRASGGENNVFNNNTAIFNNQYGFRYQASINDAFKNNNASSNQIGFHITGSYGRIEKNIAFNNLEHGFRIWSSSNSIYDKNKAVGNGGSGFAIAVPTSGTSQDDTFTNNVAELNGLYGFDLYGVRRGTLFNNIIKDNPVGMMIQAVNGTFIYNNFFQNTINALEGYPKIVGQKNYWNITKRLILFTTSIGTSKCCGENILSGTYMGGNYWSDYTGTDTDVDGIGDSDIPYNASGNIEVYDYLPLVKIPVVVLVNGLLPTDMTWNFTQFYEKGLIVETVNLTPQNDFKIQASDFVSQFSTIKSKYPLKRFDVVSHSQGALPIRWYINNFFGNDIKKLVMIAPPNHGTDFADKIFRYQCLGYRGQSTPSTLDLDTEQANFVGTSADQLAPENSFLKELNKDKTDFINPESNVEYNVVMGVNILPTPTQIAQIFNFGISQSRNQKICSYTPLGDGVVTFESAILKNVPFISINSSTHLESSKNLQIINKVIAILKGVEELPIALSMLPENITNATYPTEPKNSQIFANETQLQNVNMGNRTNNVKFWLAWNNRTNILNLSLISPSNETINSSTVSPNISFLKFDNHEIISIKYPETGNWTMEITSSNLTAPSENYSTQALVQTDLFLSLGTDKQSNNPNEIINITAFIHNQNNTLAGANVTSVITKPDNSSVIIPLLDDGNHSDIDANDGIYGNSFPDTSLKGVYSIFASGDITLSPTVKREMSTFFTIEQFPNLMPTDIIFSNNNPRDGKEITISANISNIGEYEAKNITVFFYDGPMSDEIVISNKSIEILLPNSSAIVSTNWIAEPNGTHSIIVFISPLAPFTEMNYSDNQLSRSINVSVMITSQVNMLLNGSDSSITVEKGSTVNITAELISGEDIIELYENGLLINSGTSPLTNLRIYNNVGYYNITVTYPITENYTSSSETHFIFVVDTTPPLLVFVPPTPINTVITQNFAFINITSNEELSSAILEWNNVNESMFGSGNNWYKNKTSLSNGNYSFMVYGIDLAGNSNKTDKKWVFVNVTLPDTAPPVITILSPQNITYTTSSVDLTFTINEPFSWIGYSLNDQPNITIVGNTTLSGFDGMHKIIIYANDTEGNMGISDIVYFTVSIGIPINSCQVISSSGYYYLTQNVSSSGTCINITADNVTLDCNGYAIVGNNTGYGIYANEKNNLTIKNCIINKFSRGISVSLGNNINILESNLRQNDGRGIYFGSINNGTISSNVISDFYDGAIELTGSSNVVISNNLISNKTWGYGASIYIVTNSINNKVINNTFSMTGLSIFIDSSNYNLIENNILLGPAWALVRTWGITHHNDFVGNYIRNSNWGFHFQGSNSYHKILNNDISQVWAGIDAEGTITYSLISNNKIYNGTYSGIRMYSGSNHNIFSNNLITHHKNDPYGGGINGIGSNNNTFTNNIVCFNVLYDFRCGGATIGPNSGNIYSTQESCIGLVPSIGDCSMIHDIAIVNVTPSYSYEYEGNNLNISVTVRNEGVVNETFDVTAYYNSTSIGTQTVTDLSPNTNATLIFNWNTSGLYCKNFTISVNTSIVLGETDTADNSLVYGIVRIKLQGDINDDGNVNVGDVGKLSAHWYPGPPVGPLGYDRIADLNNDGTVNIGDAGIVSAHWWPGPPIGPLGHGC